MTDTTVTEELWTRVLEALALPADADVETVVAALEDLVTTPPADPKAVAAAAGLTALDPAVVEQLKADAEQGRTIAAAAAKRDVDEKVRNAVRRGKIPPSGIKHWTTLIVNDPSMADTLASIADNTLPVMEIGHSNEDVLDDKDLIKAAPWFR